MGTEIERSGQNATEDAILTPSLSARNAVSRKLICERDLVGFAETDVLLRNEGSCILQTARVSLFIDLGIKSR